MAKHETEMHRQRRIALEALQAILRAPRIADAKMIALAALDTIQPPCDVGLFADHRQMDLADRRDIG